MFNNLQKTVIIIAPHFNDPANVGNYRIKRFIRWLEHQGIKSVVVSMGNSKQLVVYKWGINYQINNNLLSKLEFLLKIGLRFYPVKVIYVMLKLFLKAILIPDEEVLWANTVAKNKKVIDLTKKAKFILASSPLESVHVASLKLYKKTGTEYIVDLRDGWLDEPLKMDFILNIKPRMRLEAKLEKNIYQQTKKIILTSHNWEKMLLKRFPMLKEKTFTLTNAYPLNFKLSPTLSKRDKIILLYSGRIASSRKGRKVEYIFKPFYRVNSSKFKLKIIGKLKPKEIKKMHFYTKKVSFPVEFNSHMPHEKALKEINQASGLILLVVSSAAIPVKLFEYIIAQKPVLTITIPNSAVWEIVKDLPQFFKYELGGNSKQNQKAVQAFLNACQTKNYTSKVPNTFTESYLEKLFLENISDLI